MEMTYTHMSPDNHRDAIVRALPPEDALFCLEDFHLVLIHQPLVRHTHRANSCQDIAEVHALMRVRGPENNRTQTSVDVDAAISNRYPPIKLQFPELKRTRAGTRAGPAEAQVLQVQLAGDAGGHA